MMLRGLQSLTRRCFSSNVASGKSLLATLRKRTGFPIVKCKEALTRHQNDLGEAEKWLSSQAQKEGWAKVESLQGRNTKQGLIGIIKRDRKAAMVEVNCETDFVARDNQFRNLVHRVAMTIYDNISPSNQFCWDHLMKDNIYATTINLGSQTETIGDVVAKNVGYFSENVVVSRGCTLSAQEGDVASFVYNPRTELENTEVLLGSYGALVHLSTFVEPEGVKLDIEETSVLENKVCQHVIGMKPLAVNPDPENGIEESEALVKQPFIFDKSESVGDLLRRHCLQVTNFVRYGLGESSL